MITINKSLFSPEELAQYEALIAKATVDPDEAEDDSVIPRAAAVRLPTTPSAVSPLARWNAMTALSVPEPKIPSTEPL